MSIDIISSVDNLESRSVQSHRRRLHHIGFVVESIELVAERFAASIGYSWNHTIINDPLQGVRVSFCGGNDSFAQVELVEPAASNSPVKDFLKRGGGLHHLCYEVNDLEEELRLSRESAGVIVRRPLPAVAFENRRIAWVFTKDKLLVELLEASRSSEGRA